MVISERQIADPQREDAIQETLVASVEIALNRLAVLSGLRTPYEFVDKELLAHGEIPPSEGSPVLPQRDIASISPLASLQLAAL